MANRSRAHGALRNRLVLALAVGAVAALAGPAASVASPPPSVLTFQTVKVGAPGNPSVGIVPFTDAIYPSCAVAGETQPPLPGSRRRRLRYGIGELEVTVEQYVAFLNTVDPFGPQPDGPLLRQTRAAPPGRASGRSTTRRWRGARSATTPPPRRNGTTSPTASPTSSAPPASTTRSTTARCSRKTSSSSSEAASATSPTRCGSRARPRPGCTTCTSGRRRGPARQSGFVIPSQNEWIKAAYYDPSGGGTFSYWQYPTNAGVFGDETATAPAPTTLNPTTGDVTNAGHPAAGQLPRRRGSRGRAGARRTRPRKPAKRSTRSHLPAKAYEKAFQGSLNTVGQAGTYSPWGTLEQGGNAVEWTDTITPPPFGAKGHRVWRRLHGGVPNAPVYQLWLSAIGLQPQKNTFFTATYPWLGFRIGVIGDLPNVQLRVRSRTLEDVRQIG